MYERNTNGDSQTIRQRGERESPARRESGLCLLRLEWLRLLLLLQSLVGEWRTRRSRSCIVGSHRALLEQRLLLGLLGLLLLLP